MWGWSPSHSTAEQAMLPHENSMMLFASKSTPPQHEDRQRMHKSLLAWPRACAHTIPLSLPPATEWAGRLGSYALWGPPKPQAKRAGS